jgi:cell division transport system permease protein
MKLYLLLYILSEAYASIKQTKVTNLIAIGTIAVSLSIFGVFLLVYVNLNVTVQKWSEAVHITIYLKDGLPEEQLITLEKSLKELKQIETASFISKEQALKVFQERLKGQESLLAGMTGNPLPASFELKIKQRYQTLEGMKMLATQIEKFQGVDEVQYGQEWLESLSAVAGLLKLVSFFVGILLFAALVFIISNTIKLTLYARKEEIDIMRLVGATEGFIKGPFLIEGIFRGVIGSFCALLILYGVYHIFTSNLKHSSYFLLQFLSLSFLPVYLIIGILLFGGFMGWCGSALTLRRFLNIY